MYETHSTSAECLDLHPANACRDPEEDKEDEEGGEEVADTGFGGGGFTTGGGGDGGYGGGGGFGEWQWAFFPASTLSTAALRGFPADGCILLVEQVSCMVMCQGVCAQL
jgi:hypothetical protein